MTPRIPDWMTEAEGRNSYQMEGERVTHWLADGVIKQLRTVG
jgi:hypothetical protein